MLIFPAIDLVQGKAVRLYKGDYARMTVYSEDPPALARDFYNAGAKCLHLVDLGPPHPRGRAPLHRARRRRAQHGGRGDLS